MTRVVLVRHAATAWSGVRFCGRTDLPLTAAGREQAARLARRLAGARLSIATVRSSPAARARETARPLARALGVALEIDERLREVDCGLAEGRTFDEIADRWPEVARSLLAGERAIDWPEGERAADLSGRLDPVVRELDALGGDAVLVTHGGPIHAIVAALGIDPSVSSDVAPACVLALERAPGWRVADLGGPRGGMHDTKGAGVR